MYINKNIYLYHLLALSSLCACHSVQRLVRTTKDTLEYTVCKAPSRRAMIKGAKQNTGYTQTGIDTGKMVLLKGGSFEMGSNNFPDAKPYIKLLYHLFISMFMK